MHRCVAAGKHDLRDGSIFTSALHVCDEHLLRTLDGELSLDKAALVKAHLESCWSCRTRSERLAEAIGDFVEYRDSLIQQFPSPSDNARTLFIAQLHQVTRNENAPPLTARILSILRSLRVAWQYGAPRYAFICALAIAILAVVSRFSVRDTRRTPQKAEISPSQLIESAQASELRALNRVVRPVIYQKLRIRAGNEDVTRTMYNEPGDKRRSDHLKITENASSGRGVRGNRQVQADLQQTFERAHLDWKDPLSPATYWNWHSTVAEEQDEVKEDGDLITVRTTTQRDAVAEVTFTLRMTDYHPVAERVRMRNMQLIEISELDWRIIPLEDVRADIFGIDSAPSTPVSDFNVDYPAGPTETDLADAELEARLALHAKGADLGEEIELDSHASHPDRSDQRLVIVRGLLGTPKRKAELEQALAGIPNLELQLQTVEEAQSGAAEAAGYQATPVAGQLNNTEGSCARTPEPAIGGESDTATSKVLQERSTISADPEEGQSLLSAQLDEHFPNAQDRIAFLNRTVEIAHGALARAWALCRLRNRYTPEEITQLSHTSTSVLELLIRDDVSALHQYVNEAQSLILPILPPDDITDGPLAAPLVTPDWRNDVREIVPEIQRMDDSVAALFAHPGLASTSTRAHARDLRLIITELEEFLSLLDQHVNGSFLSEPDQS